MFILKKLQTVLHIIYDTLIKVYEVLHFALRHTCCNIKGVFGSPEVNIFFTTTSPENWPIIGK